MVTYIYAADSDELKRLYPSLSRSRGITSRRERHVFDVSRGNPRQIGKNSPGGSDNLPICRFPVRLDVKDIGGATDGCEAIPLSQTAEKCLIVNYGAWLG